MGAKIVINKESKVFIPDMIWGMKTCTGLSFLKQRSFMQSDIADFEEK